MMRILLVSLIVAISALAEKTGGARVMTEGLGIAQESEIDAAKKIEDFKKKR